MNHLDMSVEAWQKALAALLKDNLSASEAKQKLEYEEGLFAAKERQESPPTPVQSNLQDFPWQLAKTMEAEIRSDDNDKANSSVRGSRFYSARAEADYY